MCVLGVQCKDNTIVMGAEDGTLVLLSIAGSAQGKSSVSIFLVSACALYRHGLKVLDVQYLY